jgi:hypothetical protein
MSYESRVFDKLILPLREAMIKNSYRSPRFNNGMIDVYFFDHWEPWQIIVVPFFDSN